ncbi:MAG: D-cysteine desulfhydrase family protein, partial [Chloroflexota bacterium]
MTPKFPDKINLAHLPTPVEPLPRISNIIKGSEIYIKRDDLTGLAGGGNKTRKLEFLVAEAREQGFDHLITMGEPQSNHCRQTAAAAARSGMGCSLIFEGPETPACSGNLLLDKLLGAHLYWAGEEPLSSVVSKISKQQETLGHKPYVIPASGSNVFGTAAYVLAMKELVAQMEEQHLNFDVIVVPSDSGGTQAGLILGAHLFGFRGKIFGISIRRPETELHMQVAALVTATATHLGLDTLSLVDLVEISDDYIEPGFGVVGDLEKEALSLLAEKEGILLDAKYTARAFGGLIDLIRWGGFTRNQTILFWHTGGIPALYAHPLE